MNDRCVIDDQDHAGRRLLWPVAVPFIVVVASIICRILSYPHSLDCDVSMSLQEAQLMLEGKYPYIDFINIVPPLYYCLFLPAVWYSQVTGFSIILAADIFITMLIIYSISTSFALAYGKLKTDCMLSLACLLFGFLLCTLPLFFHFGQKDHIFVLLLMPFFLLRWLRRETEAGNDTHWFSAVVIGTFAGIGTAIKPPFYAILLVAVEIYWFITRKQFLRRIKDPEIIAFAASWLLYVLLFFGLEPDAAKVNFLSRWLPLILSGYGGYFCPLWQSILITPVPGYMLPTVWLLLPICVSALLLRKRNSLLMPLLIWTVSGYIIYLLQRKAWSTHSTVLVTGYFTLVSLELAVFAQWIQKKAGHTYPKLQQFCSAPIFTFATFSIMLSAALPWLITDSFSTGGFNYSCLRAATKKYSQRGDYVLVLSSFTPPAYPCLVQTERRPASRYLWTFPLRMYEFLKQKATSSIELNKCDAEQRKIVNEISQDVKRTSPAFIAVALDHQAWDLILMPVESAHRSEALIPAIETITYGAPNWSILSCLEAHGFEQVVENYRMAGISNGNLIWVRTQPSR